MSRRLLFIAILAVATLHSALSEQPPSLGTKFKKSWKAGKEQTLCMTGSSQLDPCVALAFDGIKYQIAYREETHRVTYVYTSDEKFRTVDGLKVGDEIPVSRETVRALPGWLAFAATTRDGWRPVVGYDGLQIKLKNGTVLDLTGSGATQSGISVILGFSKGHP